MRRATTGSGGESWLNIGTVDASWVINSLSFATMTWTHFVNRTQGRPDNARQRRKSRRRSARTSTSRTSTRRAAHRCRRSMAGDAAHNAFVQPIINQYGYVQNGVAVGGGVNGVGSHVRQGRLLPRRHPVWLQLHVADVERDAHAARRLSVVRRLGRSDAQLERLGLDLGAGRHDEASTGTPIFYQAAFQQQTTGAVPTIHSEYRSQSFEFNDSISWNNWTFNAGLLMSNDTLYGQGLREDASTLLRATSGRPGTQVQDVRDSVQQDDAAARWARPGPTTARNTVFVSYAKYNPAASSLPRAASWDRNAGDDHQRVLRRQRQPLRHRPRGLVVRQAVRARHDAADDQRSPVRHGAAVRRPRGPAGSTAGTAAAATSGRTRTTPRGVAVQPAAPAFRETLYIPDLDRLGSRRSAAARPTSSPSSTARSRSTTR